MKKEDDMPPTDNGEDDFDIIEESGEGDSGEAQGDPNRYEDDELDVSWFEEPEKNKKKGRPTGDEKYRIMAGIMTIAVCIIIVAVLAILVLKNTGKGDGGKDADDAAVLQESSMVQTGEGTGGPGTDDPDSPAESIPESTPVKVPDTSVPDSGAADGNPAGQTVTMTFEEVEETVTAKELTNLRTEPGTESQDTVAVQLKNGQTATRTGINQDKGWSRVEYNGQTLYAVSRFLTTDLKAADSKPADTSEKKEETGNAASGGVQSTGSADGDSVTTADGHVVKFTAVDDQVSPKMEVNLRLEPSTSGGNGTIHARLPYETIVHRTGVSEDSGWSRVEYDGKILYAVTSYLYAVEPVSE